MSLNIRVIRLASAPRSTSMISPGPFVMTLLVMVRVPPVTLMAGAAGSSTPHSSMVLASTVVVPPPISRAVFRVSKVAPVIVMVPAVTLTPVPLPPLMMSSVIVASSAASIAMSSSSTA